MIFLTVGSLFSFDRLVKTVDTAVGNGLIQDEVVAQIGYTTFKPKIIRFVKLLDRTEYQRYIDRADGLISHAGIGTISAALKHRKPLLVMPRMKRYGEHVNDHQVATARKFEQLGLVLAAYEPTQLFEKLKALKTFVPPRRIAQPDLVAARISSFLDALADSKCPAAATRSEQRRFDVADSSHSTME